MSTNTEMGVFEKVVGEKPQLIGSWRKLSFGYVPQKLPHREKEQERIARSIKPLLRGRKGKNRFIFGKSGIGKTVTVKKVLNELEDYTQEIKTAYVNCWDKSTTYSMVKKIVEDIGVAYKPGKGVDRLLEVLEDRLEDMKGVVVALDEVDKGRDTEILYRLHNRFEHKLAMILITNNKEFLHQLDPRIKGRLTVKELYFAPYGRNEIRDILKERARAAFQGNKVEKAALEKIVEKTDEIGDIRVGLYLLLTAGENAESSGKQRVSLENVERALEDFDKEDFMTSSSKLDSEQKMIVDTVREREGSVTGELYETYEEKGKLSSRSFRRYLRRLEDLGFLKLESTGEGFRGKSTKVFLADRIK